VKFRRDEIHESLVFGLGLAELVPPKIIMVAARKNLDSVWVWFYKDVAPTAQLQFSHE